MIAPFRLTRAILALALRASCAVRRRSRLPAVGTFPRVAREGNGWPRGILPPLAGEGGGSRKGALQAVADKLFPPTQRLLLRLAALDRAHVAVAVDGAHQWSIRRFDIDRHQSLADPMHIAGSDLVWTVRLP